MPRKNCTSGEEMRVATLPVPNPIKNLVRIRKKLVKTVDYAPLPVQD
jgi:hypothetical protein